MKRFKILFFLLALISVKYISAQEATLNSLYANGYSLMRIRTIEKSTTQNNLKITMTKGLHYAFVFEPKNRKATKVLLRKNLSNSGLVIDLESKNNVVATNYDYDLNKAKVSLIYQCQGTGIYWLDVKDFEGQVSFLWKHEKTKPNAPVLLGSTDEQSR